MLRSAHSPSDPHDDHLRLLLDQRATRADIQGRFSTLSQFSDTPSVYSRPFFSPRPVDQESLRSPVAQSLKSPTASTFSARERLNDPSTSMLDLDEDPRLSMVSDVYEEDQQLVDDDDDEPMPRMSLLGPKMRFHSRAPWEMDDETLQEENESDYGTLLPTSKKGFGFSSPRSSDVSRPSGESTRSQAKTKRSFETTISQVSYPRGALYALAQESLSTTSLSPSVPNHKTGRTKFPVNRVRSDSPNNSLPPSPTSAIQSPANARYVNVTPSLRVNHEPAFPPQDSQAFNSAEYPRHRRPTYPADDFHPYANPDLVISYAQVQPSSFNKQGISRSDSIATVTDSLSTMSRSGTRSTLTPVTSTSSVPSRNRTSTIQGREISSPISVLNRLDSASRAYNNQSPLPPQPGIDNLPGWTDRGAPPAFALISLEEARAQRSRSATAHPPLPHLPFVASSGIPFPDAGNGSENSSDYGSTTHSRARARSISAGAKAKTALQTIVGGSSGQMKADHQEPEPVITNPGGAKSLKHKKSGFMRLFNGGRGQDKEEKAQPPPVPLLSDVYAAHKAQTAQKIPKITTHRIPVPEISPSVIEGPSSNEGGSPTSQITPIPKPSPSPKPRPPPLLSINTQPQGYVNRAPSTASGETSFQTRNMPSSLLDPPRFNDSVPQSAPANVSEFPALKLRPVSTMFSAQFGDHIVTLDSRPSLETDLGTPGSSSNVFSPITPGSSTRSERSINEKHPSMASISEDQSAVISALQDQIVSAKLAWQRQIWELEGQVRDLKAEVEELRTTGNEAGYCDACGRGQHSKQDTAHRQPNDLQEGKPGGVVNRPRARTGTSSRFGSAVS
ncbi:hypothetical protein Hypma_015666 [Hypsizygus marmoreus]|uniref:Uncharacterized protein n=1 Tax=Hypsizygus marmoreus TaxID=39966 RepID=A0A369K6T5_HYPMA|nr:hypothetical protein Hypma_015666 [Hypsizygus marmoreus]